MSRAAPSEGTHAPAVPTARRPDADPIPFVDLDQQYRWLGHEIRSAIERVCKGHDFILGQAVADFEAAFATYTEVAHAVGVGNGLDALRLTLQALDIGPGDEVIVPANTYIATALAVSAVGARPVLVDCDRDTYCLDPDGLATAVTPRTRAVIPVHFGGQPAGMGAVLDLAEERRLHVIEDAAHAHGARHRDRRCGRLGIAGCFSFYPGKNLGAFGDGGAVTTDDRALAARLRRLRDYGQDRKYEHLEKGWNTRLDTLQAAVLLVKLRHLDAWNAMRQTSAIDYREALRGVGDLRWQGLDADATHVYHLFLIETEARDVLLPRLHAAGIQAGMHYPTPIHLQPAYAGLGLRPGSFPSAEAVARRTLSLPMFPGLRRDQVARVAETVRETFSTMRSNR